jgi:hypothetical protein
MRDSDNWQSGFGPGVCMKSLLRHTWDVWIIHRGGVVIEDGKPVSKKNALCAAAFNIFSQLHDMEKPRAETPLKDETRSPSLEFVEHMLGPEEKPKRACTKTGLIDDECIGTLCRNCDFYKPKEVKS